MSQLVDIDKLTASDLADLASARRMTDMAQWPPLGDPFPGCPRVPDDVAVMDQPLEDYIAAARLRALVAVTEPIDLEGLGHLAWLLGTLVDQTMPVDRAAEGLLTIAGEAGLAESESRSVIAAGLREGLLTPETAR